MFEQNSRIRVSIASAVARPCSHKDIRGSIEGCIITESCGHLVKKPAKIRWKGDADVD